MVMASLEELRAQLGIRTVPQTSVSTYGRPQPAPTARTTTPAASRPAPLPPPEGGYLAEQLKIASERGLLQPQAPVAAKADDQPWHKQVLGTVLGNSTVQNALKPLDWLQTGGRAATAGIENLARALPEGWERAIDASMPGSTPGRGLVQNMDEDRQVELADGSMSDDIGSWWDRAKDPEYGYGTAMESTGNIHLDRLQGLAGDIALDPLTYVTLGAGAAAGKSQRIGNAVRAAGMGDRFTDAQVDLIAKKSVSYLSDSERAILGVEKAGLKFAGAHVPGTGRLGRQVGKATSTVRAAIFGSRPWQKIASHPGGVVIDTTDAYRALSGNKYTGPLSPKGAAAIIDFDDTIRRVKKSVSVPAATQASKIFDGLKPEQLKALTHALESGDNSALREINQMLLEDARKAGVKIGDLGEDFIAHMWTPEGRDFLSKTQIEDVATGKKINPFKASGTTKTRAFREGKYKINGVDVDFGSGTIDEIEKALKAAFPDEPIDKFLLDDAREITSRYIDQVSSDIALVKTFREMVQKHDLFDWLDNVGDEVIDTVASNTRNDELAKVLRGVSRDRGEALKAARAEARTRASTLQAQLVQDFSERANAAGAMGQRFARIVDAIKEKNLSLDGQAKLITGQVKEIREDAQRKLSRVEALWERNEGLLEAAKVREAAAASRGGVNPAGAAASAGKDAKLGEYTRLVTERMALTKQVEEGRAAVAEIERLTDELADSFDAWRGIEEMRDNPDFVDELTQSMTQERVVTETAVVAQAKEQISQAENRLWSVDKAIEKKLAEIEEMIDNVADPGAVRQAEILDTMQSARAAYAKEVETAQAGLDDALAQLKRSRAARRDAEQLDMSVDPRNRVSSDDRSLHNGGAGRQDPDRNVKSVLREGVGSVAEAKIAKELSETLSAMHETLGLSGELHSSLKVMQEDLRLGRDLGAVATRERGNLEKGAARLEPKVAPLRAEIAETVDGGYGKYKLEQQTAESAKLLHRIWLIKDEIAKVADEARAADRLGRGALQEQRVVSEKVTAATSKLTDGAFTDPRDALKAYQSQLDETMGQLPQAEQNLLAAYQNLERAQRSAKAMDGVTANAERRWARASRLDTAEAQLSALEQSKQVLQRMVEHNRTYGPPELMEVSKVVPGEQLPGRQAILDEIEALPSEQPLKVNAAQEAAIKKVNFPNRVGTRNVLKGGQVAPEAVDAAPQEVAARWRQIVENTDGALQDRVSDAEVLDEATELAEFMVRYKAGLDAGLPDGDQLATRVAREMQATKHERLTKESERLAEALDAPLDSPKRAAEMEREFEDKFLGAAEVAEEASRRLNALRYDLRTQGGPSKAGGARLASTDVGATGKGAAETTITAGEHARREAGSRRAVTSSPDRIDQEIATQRQGFKVESDNTGVLPDGSNPVAASGDALQDLGSPAADRAQLEALIYQAKQDARTSGGVLVTMIRGLGVATEEAHVMARQVFRILSQGDDDAVLKTLWNVAREDDRMMGRLSQSLKTSLGDVRRDLRTTATTWNRLGKGSEEVVEDWRAVLGLAEPSNLPARRAELDAKLSLYDQTEANLAAASESALDDVKGLVGAVQAQKAAADALPAAERQLDALPDFRGAGSRNADRKAGVVDRLEDRASTLETAADALDGVLRAVDGKAAKEMERIDTLRKTNKFMLGQTKDRKAAAEKHAKKLRSKAKKAGVLAADKPEVAKTFEQLDKLVDQLDDSVESELTFALHAALVEQMLEVERLDLAGSRAAKYAQRVEAGDVAPVMKMVGKAGWNAIDEALQSGGKRFAYADEMRGSFKLLEQAADGEGLGQMFDTMTQLFKTYATATPGFHVRNAMSATVMNIISGVGLAPQREAISEIKKFQTNPMKYMNEIEDPRLRAAYGATFGSGAGGSFSASELGDRHSWLFDNMWTRKNRAAGERVESSVRLGMALDTIDKGLARGMSLEDATQMAQRRIETFHFDYSKLSGLDRQMKRIIPFWTFMSRNLPLQMQMMYTRPGVYSAYDHIADNLGVDVENMPRWLADRGAIALWGDDDDGYTAVAPDLPWLNLFADLETMDIRDPERVMSNLNPVGVAPLEAIGNKNFFTGGELTEEEGAEGAFDRAWHGVSSIFSPLAQGQRLAGIGRYDGVQGEKIRNFVGLPIYDINPDRMESEARRKAYAEYMAANG